MVVRSGLVHLRAACDSVLSLCGHCVLVGMFGRAGALGRGKVCRLVLAILRVVSFVLYVDSVDSVVEF